MIEQLKKKDYSICDRVSDVLATVLFLGVCGFIYISLVLMKVVFAAGLGFAGLGFLGRRK